MSAEPVVPLLPQLDWEAIRLKVERHRERLARAGMRGATILEIHEAPDAPPDWHVHIEAMTPKDRGGKAAVFTGTK